MSIIKDLKDKIKRSKEDDDKIKEALTGREIQLLPDEFDVFSSRVHEEFDDVTVDTTEDTLPIFGKKDGEKVSEKDIFNKKKRNKKTRRSIKIAGLNFDLIWYAVAGGCLLGVALFYFQGIQPKMLEGYTDNTLERVGNLSLASTDQLENVTILQNNLAQHSYYNKFQVCSADHLYMEFSEDADTAEMAELATLPEIDYQEDLPFNGFYEKEIREEYVGLYNVYYDDMSKINAKVTELKALPRFYDYRNIWIQACIDINESEGALSKVRETCAAVREKTDEYEQGLTVSFWSQMKEDLITDMLIDCADIERPSRTSFADFPHWKLRWMQSYEQLTEYNYDYLSSSEKIEQIASELKVSFEEVTNNIKHIYNSKIGITDIWYLMRFDF